MRGAAFAWALLLVQAWSISNAFAQVTPSKVEEAPKIRDPFKRPMTATKDEVPRTELELYPLEQFKMIGVMTGPVRVRAMLLAPNGKTYFVAENAKIGVHKGIVRKITSGSMKVREKVINVLGQEENVDSEIQISNGDSKGSSGGNAPQIGSGG